MRYIKIAATLEAKCDPISLKESLDLQIAPTLLDSGDPEFPIIEYYTFGEDECMSKFWLVLNNTSIGTKTLEYSED